MCLIREVGDPVGSCVVRTLTGDLSLCHFSWFHELTGLSSLVLTWGLSVRRLLGSSEGFVRLNIRDDFTHTLGWLHQPGSGQASLSRQPLHLASSAWQSQAAELFHGS